MNIFIYISPPINCHFSLVNLCVQSIESFRGAYWQLDAEAWLTMHCGNLKMK